MMNRNTYIYSLNPMNFQKIQAFHSNNISASPDSSVCTKEINKFHKTLPSPTGKKTANPKHPFQPLRVEQTEKQSIPNFPPTPPSRLGQHHQIPIHHLIITRPILFNLHRHDPIPKRSPPARGTPIRRVLELIYGLDRVHRLLEHGPRVEPFANVGEEVQFGWWGRGRGGGCGGSTEPGVFEGLAGRQTS